MGSRSIKPDGLISHFYQPENKVENESLRKELQEKQELLCQASKAMELMEHHHKKQNDEAQMVIDDLNHKIEAMAVSWRARIMTFHFIKIAFLFPQHEIKSMEKALVDNSRNNDTGFSDFLGAIDAKDIETQQKVTFKQS